MYFHFHPSFLQSCTCFTKKIVSNNLSFPSAWHQEERSIEGISPRDRGLNGALHHRRATGALQAAETPPLRLPRDPTRGGLPGDPEPPQPDGAVRGAHTPLHVPAAGAGSQEEPEGHAQGVQGVQHGPRAHHSEGIHHAGTCIWVRDMTYMWQSRVENEHYSVSYLIASVHLKRDISELPLRAELKCAV